MIKQFEVGKSYYREIPTNPNFAVIEDLDRRNVISEKICLVK